MGTIVVDNEHIVIEEHDDRQVVTLRRKASLADTATIIAAYGAALEQLRAEHASWGLVIDTRAPAGRNDPEFERAVGEVRREVERRFARVVVLVSSAVGELQVRRLGRENARRIPVTRDPEQAMAWAAGGSGPDDHARRQPG